jgi:hypothetical protein
MAGKERGGLEQNGKFCRHSRNTKLYRKNDSKSIKSRLMSVKV